jgi:2-dehydropantoate 2-reductase
VDVLVVGAGVIGTVYGAQLAAGGHSVAVLAHGQRTDHVADAGLVARDVISGTRLVSPVTIVATASSAPYDLIVVAIRYGQLAPLSAALLGEPTVLYFGNNPLGRPSLPVGLPGELRLGFPGIGGSLTDGVVEYVRIAQQPTALETGPSLTLDEFERTLHGREFKTQRVGNMDGWLAYHAVFIAAVTGALYRCGTDAGRLARDRRTLSLMCRAISEGFAALRHQGLQGAPSALAFLQRAPLRPLATTYWSRMLRPPMGEFYFAGHARNAPDEMRALGVQALARVGQGAPHLHQLLES